MKLRAMRAFLGGMIFFSQISAVFAEELFPQAYVQSLLREYTQEERDDIQKDLLNIDDLCFKGLTPTDANQQKIYIATAGAPGSGKSTILEIYLQDHPGFVYLDPDQRTLRFMINTYYKGSALYAWSVPHGPSLAENLYNKWREASNYIAVKLLDKAYAEGYPIAHGASSTGVHVVDLYKKLKKAGYKIILLLCGSTDKNRFNAISYRTKVQNFVQSTPQDVVEKGKIFHERFPDYFLYADEILIYWADHFQKPAILAVTFEKEKGLTVHDPAALERFTKKFDADRAGKGLSFPELVAKNTSGRK